MIPQILTNNAKNFIHTSKKIKQLGYDEINLNLGCPYGIVVSKNRDSGFLEKNLLKDFHDKIYEDYKRILSGDKNVLFKMKAILFLCNIKV